MRLLLPLPLSTQPNRMSEQAAIMELQRALGRVEGKVDSLLVRLEVTLAETDKHEERIAYLERWRSLLLGMAVASGALFGTAWKLLSLVP